jgi:hypothetical protein
MEYILRSIRAWPFSTHPYFLLALALSGPRVWSFLRRLKGDRTVEKEDINESLSALPTLDAPTATERGSNSVPEGRD